MKFQSTIKSLYGEKGLVWLAKISNKTERLSKLWSLSDLKPVNNMTYNYVLAGFQNGQPVVLKLSMDHAGLEHEAEVLNAFKQHGCIQVKTSEPGALLLERAIPGSSLKSYFPNRDLDAIQITCELISKLHLAPIPKDHSFPHIRDWLTALDDASQIPKPILSKAIDIRDKLLQTSDPDVLLHGDLHHDNILQNGYTWVAIDPKGVIGDPVYEVAAFIRNPVPDLLSTDDPKGIIHQRIMSFARHANLDPNRVRDWCFVQAVLSWAWALEDEVDADYFERISSIALPS